MVQVRFTEEFRQEAVRQVVERGHPVAEVAARLGVSQHSLYAWLKKHRKWWVNSCCNHPLKSVHA